MRSCLVAHAGEFLEAPLVRLVEVDDGAEEPAGVQLVRLASDGVDRGGERQQFVFEELPEAPVRGRRDLGAAGQLGAERVRHGGAVVERRALGQAAEEPVLRAVAGGLLRDQGDLPLRRGDVLARALEQGLADALERVRQRVQPVGDVVPVRLRRRRHQVDDLADGLRRARDHVEVAQVELPLVRLLYEVEFGAEVGLRDLVDRVDRRGGVEGALRRPRRIGQGGCSGGRGVAVLPRPTRHTDVRRRRRVEVDEGGDPSLGHVVDGGLLTDGTRFAHAPTLSTSAVRHAVSAPRSPSSRRHRPRRRAAR